MTLINRIYRPHAIGQLPPASLLPGLLAAEQLPAFRALACIAQQRPRVRGYQQRMGAGNVGNLSRYRVLKERGWPAVYTEALRQHLPELVACEATHWLIHFEPGDFLDEQDAWVERHVPVDFLMVALQPDQALIVGGERYGLQPGDAIRFNPSYRHEVPPTSAPASWLGFMIFRHAQEV